MLNRRKALIGAAALAAPAAATAAQSDDALIEKYATALYEAYYEAMTPYWIGGSPRIWGDTLASERDFAKAHARLMLGRLGLLPSQATIENNLFLGDSQ